MISHFFLWFVAADSCLTRGVREDRKLKLKTEKSRSPCDIHSDFETERGGGEMQLFLDCGKSNVLIWEWFASDLLHDWNVWYFCHIGAILLGFHCGRLEAVIVASTQSVRYIFLESQNELRLCVCVLVCVCVSTQGYSAAVYYFCSSWCAVWPWSRQTAWHTHSGCLHIGQ